MKKYILKFLFSKKNVEKIEHGRENTIKAMLMFINCLLILKQFNQ